MKNQTVNPKLLVAIGLLVVVAGYLMVVRPQGSRLGEVRDERASTEQQVTVARQQAANTPTTVASSEPTAADLAVPADPALPSVLRQLQAVAGESGLRHTTVTPSPPAQITGLPGGSVQLTIEASGPRAGAYVYLNRLATLPRLIVVEQMAISRDGRSG